ncbi:MAG: DMT family transporter [Phycisphaerales bacterium]|nr:DMT family transporter [Phycisphaerales bacterium]
MTHSRAVIYMSVGALFFALTGEFVHGLSDSISWQTALLARGGFGLMVALVIAHRELRNFPLWHRGSWLRSIGGTFYLALLYYTIQHMPPAEALAITNTRPLWIAILSFVFLRLALKWQFWPAVLSAFIGSLLLSGLTLSSQMGLVWIAFVAAGCGSLGYFAIDYCRDISAPVVVVHMSLGLFIGGLILVLWGGIGVQLSKVHTLTDISLLIGLGVVGTFYHYFVTIAIQALGSVSGSVVGLLTAIFAYGLDFLLWNYGFDIYHMIGIIMILIPAFYIATGHSLVRPRKLSARKHAE